MPFTNVTRNQIIARMNELAAAVPPASEIPRVVKMGSQALAALQSGAAIAEAQDYERWTSTGGSMHQLMGIDVRLMKDDDPTHDYLPTEWRLFAADGSEMARGYVYPSTPE